MSILLATNPQGVEIKFNEKQHKYYTTKVQDFTSATTLIHKYFKPFDRDNIARRYATKHGLNFYDVLNKWQHEADISIELGNMVHKFCEEKLLNLDYTIKPYTDKHKNVLRVADRTVDFLLNNFEFIESEKIIFSEEYKVAGTIDLLMKRNNVIYILDWKTNKKIETKNIYHKYGLDCISHLDDNNYTHYQLQLNLYKWLLQKENYYNCDIKLKLIHITEDNCRFYDCRNLQSEISEIMEIKKLSEESL